MLMTGAVSEVLLIRTKGVQRIIFLKHGFSKNISLSEAYVQTRKQ